MHFNHGLAPKRFDGGDAHLSPFIKHFPSSNKEIGDIRFDVIMLEIGKAKIILKIDTLCAIHYRIDHQLLLVI